SRFAGCNNEGKGHVGSDLWPLIIGLGLLIVGLRLRLIRSGRRRIWFHRSTKARLGGAISVIRLTASLLRRLRRESDVARLAALRRICDCAAGSWPVVHETLRWRPWRGVRVLPGCASQTGTGRARTAGRWRCWP